MKLVFRPLSESDVVFLYEGLDGDADLLRIWACWHAPAGVIKAFAIVPMLLSRELSTRQFDEAIVVGRRAAVENLNDTMQRILNRFVDKAEKEGGT